MKCVIVAGAEIRDYSRIVSQISKDDFYIYCDSGLKHRESLYEPDLIIGDFDSHEYIKTDIETIVLPHEKDDTDSVFAVKEALKRGYRDIVMVGVTGNRMDHTLCNISCLEYIWNHGGHGVIIDDYSVMEIVGKNDINIDKSFAYFSLVNIYGQVKGVNITGARYNLYDAAVTTDYQYAISNEIDGDVATVSVDTGILLLIKIFKE